MLEGLCAGSLCSVAVAREHVDAENRYGIEPPILVRGKALGPCVSALCEWLADRDGAIVVVGK
jgi:hypothetical protein